MACVPQCGDPPKGRSTLYDGREWRIHYWMFRKDRIYELPKEEDEGAQGQGGVANVYAEVPGDISSQSQQ